MWALAQTYSAFLALKSSPLILILVFYGNHGFRILLSITMSSCIKKILGLISLSPIWNFCIGLSGNSLIKWTSDPAFQGRQWLSSFLLGPLYVVVGLGLNNFHPGLKTSHLAPVTASPGSPSLRKFLSPLLWSRKFTFQAFWTLCLLSFLSHSLQGPTQAPDHFNPQGSLPALKLGVPCLCFSDNFIEVLLSIAVDLCLNRAGLPVPVIISLRVENPLCAQMIFMPCWGFSQVSDFFF